MERCPDSGFDEITRMGKAANAARMVRMMIRIFLRMRRRKESRRAANEGELARRCPPLNDTGLEIRMGYPFLPF